MVFIAATWHTHTHTLRDILVTHMRKYKHTGTHCGIFYNNNVNGFIVNPFTSGKRFAGSTTTQQTSPLASHLPDRGCGRAKCYISVAWRHVAVSSDGAHGVIPIRVAGGGGEVSGRRCTCLYDTGVRVLCERASLCSLVMCIGVYGWQILRHQHAQSRHICCSTSSDGKLTHSHIPLWVKHTHTLSQCIPAHSDCTNAHAHAADVV